MKLPSIIRRLRAHVVYNDGLALIPSNVNSAWPQRQFLRRLLHRLEADCVVDVGANVGQYGSELRNLGFDGTLLSFEPDPSCFETLRKVSASDSKWHVYNVALGSMPGFLDFNIMVVSLFNSFRKPSVEDTREYELPNSVKKQINVKVETLNDLLPKLQKQFGFKKPFLKMDTQGFDDEVFKGANVVHDLLIGFQSELAVKNLYANTRDWTDMIEHYKSCDFELAGMYAVNAHVDELVEFDCYFVKPKGKT